MKSRKYRSLLYYLSFVTGITLLITGCKPMQQVQLAEPIELPSSFPGQPDTGVVVNFSWKQIFTDKDLRKLIDTALYNNWDLQSAIQRVEMARANFMQTRGAMKPSVQAIVAAGVDKYGDYTLNGVGNFDTNLSGNIDKDQKIPTPLTPDYFLGFRSSWEIDLWGKLRSQKSAAYHRLLSSQKGVQLVRTTLVSEVASRYYELLALNDELDVLQRNIQLQQSAVELVKVQKEGGRANELAVQQFTAQLLRTKALETAINQQITETENEINLLLGRLPQKFHNSKSILQQQVPQTVSAGLPSSLLLRRPDIQQAELQLKAGEADVAAARAAFLPSLTLTPYLALNAFSVSSLVNPGSLAYGVIGGLAAPVLNRTTLKGDHKRSLAAMQEAYNNYQEAILKGYTEVVTNLNKLKNLQKQYELREQETAVLKNAVITSNDLYMAGAANYIEVITSQKGVIDAELGLITTKKDMLITLVSLYRALGGGSE